MSGTNNFAKKYFLTPFWDSTKFSLFCKGRACRFSVKKSNFPKTTSNVDEMFLLMSGTNYFAKKYFLTPFWDSTKFSLFCKVRACGFSAKKSNFPKTASNVDEMFLLMSGTKNFAKKLFFTTFWDSTKFSLFCKVLACLFSVKSSIFQKLP